MLPGMSILMSRIAGSAGGWAAGAAGGCFPLLLLTSTTLSTTTLGGKLSGRLISARSMVSGAVTFGAVRGPVIDTVPVAVATASSRAATRKFASVADNAAVGPEGPLSATLPCAFFLLIDPAPAEKEVKVIRSRSPAASACRLVRTAPVA